MILEFALMSLAHSVQSAPQAAPSPAPTKERKICRREEAAIGSRLSGGRQICKTAAEWNAERADQKALIEDSKRQPAGN